MNLGREGLIRRGRPTGIIGQVASLPKATTKKRKMVWREIENLREDLQMKREFAL